MRRASLAALGVAVAALASGCEDVPLVPKWDADWYLPVASEAIRLDKGFPPVPIPSGTAATIADTSQQGLDEGVGQLLERQVREARMILTLAKSASLEFSLADTLVLAGSEVDLGNPAAQRIVIPITLGATATSRTDTAAVSSGGIAMLQQVAEAGGQLFVELRGRVAYEGSSSYTVQPTDTIGVKLAILARIGVSTR